MSQWHQVKTYLIDIYKSIQEQTNVLGVSSYQSFIESTEWAEQLNQVP